MNLTRLIPTAMLIASAACVAPAHNRGEGMAMANEAGRTLDGEALRRLFLNGLNTYLTPVRSGEVVISHPPGELFRPNGTYHRSLGRTGIEGWYGLEGAQLCVWGDSIAKQCRKVISQDGKTYLLVDVADRSRALMTLSQRN